MELIRSSVHTQQAAVFARMCAQPMKMLEKIKLKGDRTHILNDTNIGKSGQSGCMQESDQKGVSSRSNIPYLYPSPCGGF